MKKFFKLSVYIFVASLTVSLKPIEVQNKTAYYISLFVFKEVSMAHNLEKHASRVMPINVFIPSTDSNEQDINLTPDINNSQYTIYLKQGEKAVITMDEKSDFDGIVISYEKFIGPGSYEVNPQRIFCYHDDTIIIDDEVKVRWEFKYK